MDQRMKAAVYHAPQQLTIEEVNLPDVGPDDLLIRVKNCGICGSDLHSYKCGMYIKPGQIMGHEFIGVAAKVGRNVQGVKEGDRATGFSVGVCGKCFWCARGEFLLCPDLFLNSTGYGQPGALAEYVRIKSAVLNQNVYLIPKEIDDVTAATIEPVSVGVYAVQAANVKPGDKVVVLGAGMIGNACLQAAKAAGATQVVVVEVSPIRLQAALDSGADAVFDARSGDALEWIMDTVGRGRYHFHEGGMADVVIEAAGSPATIEQSFEMVRAGGVICFVGLPEKRASIDTTMIVHKLPKIIGCFGGNLAESINELADGRIRTHQLVTHQFPLVEAASAFEMQLRANESIKVVVNVERN